MLEADAGQHLDLRGNHAGRVEAAAEASLDHRHLDAPSPQLRVGGGGQHLELRHSIVGRRGAIDQGSGMGRTTYGGAEVRRFEVVVVDPDPLAE